MKISYSEARPRLISLNIGPSSMDSQLAQHGLEYHEELRIMGALQAGMTFSLSSSSLHFYTILEDTTAVSTVLEEVWWVGSP